jgi:hypothetical protein
MLEYRLEIDDLQLPEDVVRTWRRYGVASTFYDGLAKEGAGWVQSFMKGISGWRLRNNNYSMPVEGRLFHAYVKATRQDLKINKAPSGQALDRTPGVTPSAPL